MQFSDLHLLTELLSQLMPLFLIADVFLTCSLHYTIRTLLEQRLQAITSKRAVKEHHRAHTNDVFSGRHPILSGLLDSLQMRWQRDMIRESAPELKELLSLHDTCMLLFPLTVGFLTGGLRFPALLCGGIALVLLLTGIRIRLAFIQ
jgi:hypothetical protein